MKIKAKQAFLSYDGAKPIIARRGSIHDVSEATAKGLVYDGLAEFVDNLKEEKNAVRKASTRKAAKVEK